MGNKLTSKVIIEGTRLIFCHRSPESFEFARPEQLKTAAILPNTTTWSSSSASKP